MQSLLQKARCLRKNMTPAEKKLWSIIRRKKFEGLHFRRQVPFGSYIVDFICLEAKIIIELDGSQHGHERAMKYDQTRTNYLESFGFKVLRFWNHEILQKKESVKQIIWDVCFLKNSPFSFFPQIRSEFLDAQRKQMNS